MTEPKTFPIFSMINDFESKSFHLPEIRAHHRSLYYFLLGVLMQRRGANCFEIAYDYGMQGAKIGNHKTYTSALKDLEVNGFLTYTPGKNRFSTPIIDLHFCTPTNNLLQVYRESIALSTANNIKAKETKEDLIHTGVEPPVAPPSFSEVENPKEEPAPEPPKPEPDKPLSDEAKYLLFISAFNFLTGRNYKGDAASKRNFKARLKEGVTGAELKTAIRNCLQDPFHQANPNYLTPEFITRADKLEKFLNAQPLHEKKEMQDKGCGFIKRTQAELDAIWGEKKPDFIQPDYSQPNYRPTLKAV